MKSEAFFQRSFANDRKICSKSLKNSIDLLQTKAKNSKNENWIILRYNGLFFSFQTSWVQEKVTGIKNMHERRTELET